MDYEKAYKNALNRAKEYHFDGAKQCITDTLEYIFPELKESEDELTWLTKFIEEETRSLSMDIRDNEDSIKLKNLKKSLVWLEKQGQTFTKKDVDDAYLKGISDAKNELEKQGEQKSIEENNGNNRGISSNSIWSDEDEIEIPFGAKDSELQEATYYIPKGFHAEIDDDKVVIKKGEKSAAWSKDDEAMFQSCTGAIWAADYYLYEDKQDMEAWLKSLKNRIGG